MSEAFDFWGVRPRFLTMAEFSSLFAEGCGPAHRGEDLSFYCPAAGGYGIPRIACLVPQSHVLFVAPQGCGRHGLISAYLYGNKERIHSLYISETDLALGAHMDQIAQAAARVAEQFKPKALTLVFTCADDLLGSDYESAAAELEASLGIPVRVGAMNPIRTESARAPLPMIWKTVFSFLEKSRKGPGGNLLLAGTFSKPDKGCELYSMLGALGISLSHIRDFETFGEFRALSESRLTLVASDAAELAAAHMEKTLGIPALSFPMSLRTEQIARSYSRLGRALGTKLRLRPFLERYRDEAPGLFKALRGLRVAVGASNPLYPFEIARLLEENGVHVTAVFPQAVGRVCRGHLKWLSEKAPHIRVLPPNDRTAAFLSESGVGCDVAVGMDAAYYTGCRSVAEVCYEDQLFGFSGQLSLLERLAGPKQIGGSFEDILFASNLVV